MPTRLAVSALLTICLTALPGGTARAQSSGDSDGGLVGLVLPVGARAIGQGRAVVATRAELQAMPYNPATVDGLERGALTFSRLQGTDDAGFDGNYVAGAVVSRWGTFAAQLVLQDYGEIPLTDSSPDVIGSAEIADWSAGVTWAHHWRDRLSYGATAKFFSSDLGVTTGDGMAFDVGLVYLPRPGSVPMSFGVSLRNLGGDLTYDPVEGSTQEAESDNLPSRVRLGVSATPERFFGLPAEYRIALAFDIESDLRELSNSSQHGGIALTVHDLVVLRGGFLLLDNPYVDSGDGDRSVGGSFGIGIHYERFEADLAREVSVSELGDETHFSAGFTF
ncbi:MAG TPA: PorV/PorQ family protein [Gemmatimonadota bacterium]|nr:PorV/PorQ family protein [Gemmatimonadota bacterium]